jgi:diguanylate cyclase (GGDEF)-like protein
MNPPIFPADMSEPRPDQDATVAALHVAVNSYLATLLAVAGTVFRQCPQVGVVHQDRLVRLRRRLAFDASAQAIAESQVEVEGLLQDYGKRSNEYIERIWRDVVDVLRGATGMSERLATRQAFYSDRLAQFAAELDSSRLPEDREAVEQMLALHRQGLNECVNAMNSELGDLLDRFRADVHQLATRLAESRAATLIDPVTGLVNRTEIERTLTAELESPKPFCVLLFEISEYNEIAARFGLQASHDLLKQFGTRLTEQVRPRDIVGRWGENVFTVVFRCKRAEALPRFEQISRWLTDAYTLQGHVERVHVTATGEVVEPETNADPATLFRQLDQALAPAAQ